MADLQERDAKLIQYLNEAYGKEKELETSLQAHIQMTSRATYKKRLKDHLSETKQQSKGLSRRIKELGGKAEAAPVPAATPDVVADAAGAVTSLANKAVSAAKGPLHAVRGTSEPEKMLKNAKTEFWNEAEEIANYNAIETLAEALGDKETAKLAREYRRQEERMSKFLERTIPQLTKEVVKAEIPASQRNGGRKRRTTRASSSGSGTRSTAKRSTTKRSTTKGSTAKRSTTKGSTAKRSTTSKRATSPRSKSASSGTRASASRSGSTRRKPTASRSTRGRARSGTKS